MDTLHVDYKALYRAWAVFRKGKRPSRAIDEFAYNLEANIEGLTTDINNKTYEHGNYQTVILHEKKRRDLAVAGVRDRVVHRLLYDYLTDIYDKTFDTDVWSCRVDKGLHKCLARTQQLLTKHSNSYVWRADIAKFFDHVDHTRLTECLRRKIGCDNAALWLCQEVIASYNALASKQASKQARHSDWQSDQPDLRQHLPPRIRPLCSPYRQAAGLSAVWR